MISIFSNNGAFLISEKKWFNSLENAGTNMLTEKMFFQVRVKL